MGIIKGTILFLLSSLLVLSLLAGNIALSMYISVGSENFKEKIVGDISDVLKNQTNTEESIQGSIPDFKEQCVGKKEITINYGDFNSTVSCENIDEAPDALIKESIRNLLNRETSSKDCDSPLNCFSKYKNLFFSETAKDYWKVTFILFLVISLSLIAGMFFFIENKADLPISVGFLVGFSSLPFIVINFMLPHFEKSVLKPIATILSGSYTVFIIMFTVGAILVISGFGLKFIKIGEYISKKFNFKKKSD